MCGRYNLISDARALIDHFEIEQSLIEPAGWQPCFNIAPGQSIPIVRNTGKGRELLLARWGLVPKWSRESTVKYSTINARAETVAEKPAYRQAYRRQRCLIPATGFYEWARNGEQKTPYHICKPDGSLFALAGIWDHWQGDGEAFDSCSIIVTGANRQMHRIHDRMPVILDETYYKVWMNPAAAHDAQLKALLVPYTGELRLYPVSRAVNSPKNNDARCIEEAEPDASEHSH